MVKVSVIICCHNSAERLGPTLDALMRQDVPADFEWEIILVDNNCSDETVSVAREKWKRRGVELRVVEESTPGLSAARDRGLKDSLGRYLLFCDDDNWLFPDFLRLAHDFMEQHPGAGAVGGHGLAVSEKELPDWFDRFETAYACGETRPSGKVHSLIGAGLFLRKEALLRLHSFQFQSLLSDRLGKELSSGGDIELTMALNGIGWDLYFAEFLRFKHYMEQSRLCPEYLIRMVYAGAQARPVLNVYSRIEKRLDSLGGISELRARISLLVRAMMPPFNKELPDADAVGIDRAVALSRKRGRSLKERQLVFSGEFLRLRGKVLRNLGLKKE